MSECKVIALAVTKRKVLAPAGVFLESPACRAPPAHDLGNGMLEVPEMKAAKLSAVLLLASLLGACAVVPAKSYGPGGVAPCPLPYENCLGGP